MTLKDKRILVTGGKGFLGQHVLQRLREGGCTHLAVADLPDYDLVGLADIRRMYTELQPEIVIHLAAKVGGIGFNQENPATLFYDNALMGIQLIHEGYLHKLTKFVAIGTICAYPKFATVPFREEDIWNGYPEETNAPYGLAKKMMLVQSQAYRQQYGFDSIYLLPVNLYGPGDNFSFKSSHVIPALVRKLHLADLLLKNAFEAIRRDFQRNMDGDMESEKGQVTIRENSPVEEILQVLSHYGISRSRNGRPSSGTVEVEVWGTGQATREFFFVEDAAEAIVLATESYDKSDPINIGAGFEISISELVDLLVKLTGFEGHITWNRSRPDGQPRRMLNTGKAQAEFGFLAKTGFEVGLRKTIEWYKSQD